MQLVIGNKNYSTWSLRPWLLLQAFDIEFEEVNESLRHTGLRERLLRYSPTARVPVLIDGDLCVWDSLAICEYVNELYLDGAAWPESPEKRAQARAITCEMHSGFSALRSALPMNLRARRSVELSSAVHQDLQRVQAIFSGAEEGKWLFGNFGIVDCFYAPLVLRLPTYGIALEGQAEAYARRLRGHVAVQRWIAQSAMDTEYVVEDEAGEEIGTA